jgi:hypothetical protein
MLRAFLSHVNLSNNSHSVMFCFQIKLLQGASNAYNLPDDPAFDRWFDSILVLDDREAYELSCQIEAPAPGQGGGSGGTSRELRLKKRAGSVLLTY